VEGKSIVVNGVEHKVTEDLWGLFEELHLKIQRLEKRIAEYEMKEVKLH